MIDIRVEELFIYIFQTGLIKSPHTIPMLFSLPFCLWIVNEEIATEGQALTLVEPQSARVFEQLYDAP